MDIRLSGISTFLPSGLGGARLGLPKLTDHCQQDAAVEGGWSEEPGSMVLLFPKAAASWAEVPGQ